MEYPEVFSDIEPKKSGQLCYSYIPARVVFVILGFFGFCLIYAYRVVLSVAIIAMVGRTNSSRQSYDCPVDNITYSEYKYGEFNWSSDTQATILGAFFYGYVLTQIPGGVLAEKFGAKWIFGISILITGLLSLFSPFAARWGSVAFFLTRFGQGLAEGVVWPCMNSMISKWMPKMERSRGSTIIFTGSQIGTVLCLPLAGYLCDGTFMGGWPAIFYLLGVLGVVWFVLWSAFVFESPDTHPYISEIEFDFIKHGQGEEQMIMNGLMSSLPYLLQAFIGWIASLLSDKVRQSGKVSVNFIRKVNNSIAFLSPALCMLGVVYSKCNTTLSIIFFTLAMGLNGCCYPGFNSTHVDMAPDFAGTLMGLTNTFGNLPGFIAPLVANALTENGQTLTNWSYVFYISTAVYLISALIYIFFASAQLQPWGIGNRKSTVSLQTIRSNVVKDPALNFQYIRRLSNMRDENENSYHFSN